MAFFIFMQKCQIRNKFETFFQNSCLNFGNFVQTLKIVTAKERFQDAAFLKEVEWLCRTMKAGCMRR